MHIFVKIAGTIPIFVLYFLIEIIIDRINNRKFLEIFRNILREDF